jgi:hypothetical protein
MFSAIVMAGYNNKWGVRKYAKSVAEHYGEKFIETGYKPLREFEAYENGKLVRKPLIQFTLETLAGMEQIGDITIVGHQKLLEQRLDTFLKQLDRPYKIINQSTKISPEVIKQFNIIPRKVKYSSIAGNMIKAYAESAAGQNGTHALFIASDSPMTTGGFIEYFLDIAMEYEVDFPIILPGVLIEDYTDRFGRVPLRLINDSGLKISDRKDSYGRQGFRLSSVIYANPGRFDINTTNTAYNLRKCLNPKIQLKLFRITRKLGYANIYSKYFLRKDLSVTEVENITSAFFNGRLKLIPVRDVESSYDYDGTQAEFSKLNEMLKKR